MRRTVIQVGNPIAILTQDTAKSFLFKCDPHKLYTFFMKATQLKVFKRDVNLAKEQWNLAEKLLREKEDGLPRAPLRPPQPPPPPRPPRAPPLPPPRPPPPRFCRQN
jgi:hypothetical protein